MNPDQQSLVNWAYQKVVEANGDERGIKLAIAGVLVEAERTIANLIQQHNEWILAIQKVCPEAGVASICSTAVKAICLAHENLQSQLADLTRQRDEARDDLDNIKVIFQKHYGHDTELAHGTGGFGNTVDLLCKDVASLRIQLGAETKARVEAERVAEGYLQNANPTACGACAEGICCGSTMHEHEGCIFADLATLTARVAELEADRERLDWLEGEDILSLDWVTPSGTTCGMTIDPCERLGAKPNLRAAIDAARSAQPEGGV